ncbi:MAG: hypothetical protein DRI23_08020 [Candidatus Cloacimonadota bacterium]|nr:MAG: hypothetical protein DRI23_08020 [Candidatus Cloacimonadota bacterium]
MCEVKMKKKDDINKAIEKIKKNLKDSPKEALKLAAKVSKQINLIENETERAKLHYELGRCYSSFSKYETAGKLLKQALNVFEILGEKKYIMKCYYFIGNTFLRLDNFDEAIKYYTLSFNTSSTLGDKQIQRDSALNLGRAYHEIGDNEKSLEKLFYLLNESKKEDDTRGIIGSLINIGNNFNNVGLYDRAIKYHQKALEISETYDDQILLGSVLFNNASSYSYVKDYDLSYQFYNKALTIFREENNKRLIAFTLNNIGDIYINQKKYESALTYYLQAEEYVVKSDKYSLAPIMTHLGAVYFYLGKLDKVEPYLDKAIELVEELNVKQFKLETYRSANEIYFQLNEFAKAYKYQKKFFEVKESILNAETAQKIANAQKQKIDNLFIEDNANEKFDFPEIIGRSKIMNEVFSMINMVAEHNVNVMITGPTGSGKELVAKAIHRKYKKNSPFIAINCSAIPEHLLESELFGYAKGAFTGAINNKKGKIEMANNGTLFLDEIGDMPLSLQSKMLRVIQERTVTPVGSTKSIPVSIRIVSATHRDLQEMINNAEFREDLFYRLNVIKIEIPTLQERKIDIPLLVNHFISKYNKKFNKKIKTVSADALNYLLSLPWQGNVRELENEIEKAVLLCGQDTLHIELFVAAAHKTETASIDEFPINWSDYKLFKTKIGDDLDLKYVKKILAVTNQDIPKACELGKLNKSQIYRILKKKTSE